MIRIASALSRMCGHLLHRWAQRVCFVGVEILEKTRELRAFRVRQRSPRLGRTEGLVEANGGQGETTPLVPG